VSDSWLRRSPTAFSGRSFEYDSGCCGLQAWRSIAREAIVCRARCGLNSVDVDLEDLGDLSYAEPLDLAQHQRFTESGLDVRSARLFDGGARLLVGGDFKWRRIVVRQNLLVGDAFA
jgi:hypothetical protein